MSMASSSSSPSDVTFSSEVWKYHVFLSFRGEDTRKTFVDHLYTALEQQGIYTYKDDETLPRGESIGPSLEKAIEESQIAVIIFSKNYADSSWCLDELVHIMKCKDARNQIVMPVFYNVDPAEVRKQKRKYREAFAKHALENNKKVESWKKALVDASNISGWEPEHIANGHESKCIKTIVDTISRRLHPITSSVDDNLVGVEARMQRLISQIGFGGKRMIGIWGVGGGGKTTLASSIYDEISSMFDGCCFLKNIREESSNKDGLENLQAEILSGILKQEKLEVRRVEEGRRMLKDRLQYRKVLIVLDDVDNLDQLEELAGSRDWFGEGSRIITTTRDEHVLTGDKVDVIHNISLLNNDEAMKLFYKHAPRGHRRIEDYERLSKDVVSYSGGLPLALRVLGRFLCDKEMNEWRSALARLKEIPDANILEKLKISFDGLTPLERELFLDIACFFRRRLKDEESLMILDVCGYHPVIGIKVLVQKALIVISEDGRFDMHDLVQEMAHYIVRRKHPKNPEKHSRVWKKEDILKICAMDVMTNLDKIEAIYGRWCRSDESQRVLQVATNMKKLRWIYLANRMTCVMDERKVNGGTLPLIIVPEHFPPRELCCLTFNWLNAKQLWEGNKCLPNLRFIKLQNLKNLIMTPDFDGLPNLQSFMVNGSPLLEDIHPSFGRLEKLVCVEISCCKNLKMVPPIARSMKIETLVLSRCRDLSKIQQSMKNFLLHKMNHIGCLRKLDLSESNLADGDIGSVAVWELPSLHELYLQGNSFVRLNFSLLRVPQLQYLNISECYNLVELSELPQSIAIVIADYCDSLESFGDISNCKWLWKVSLLGRNKFVGDILRGENKLGGDILLDSMLQGNAKDHFISFNLSHSDIWRGFVPWLNWEKKFTMRLPHDWYDYFCGILMFVKSEEHDVCVNITIKQGIDEDFHSLFGQESNETEISFYGTVCVGYVSFSSLKKTECLNSTYNMLSFSVHCKDKEDERRFRAVLVPRKNRDDLMQTTDNSEFWDDGKTFRVQHDSESSIKILWTPHNNMHFGMNLFNRHIYPRVPQILSDFLY
ncbi:hypothetical protein Lser_V15G37395 [Lactuca serriola]